MRGAKWLPAAAALLAGVLVARGVSVTAGSLLVLAGGVGLFRDRLPARLRTRAGGTVNAMVVAAVVVLLAGRWLPLGPEPGFARNLVFVAALLFGWLGLFRAFARHYESVLRWCLGHKAYFLAAPVFLVLLGATIWRGWEGTAGIIPSGMNRLHLPGDTLRETRLWRSAIEAFPGLGREFMPDLDEGSFLYMPTTMPHASIGEAMDVLAKLDLAISAVPEVESAVGKIGRVESALDPAPVSMVEMVVNLKSEYATDAAGTRLRFRWDDEAAEFARDERGELVPDPRGRVFRQWRDDTHSSGDIWDAIVAAGRIPGTTSAPRLQPIAARIVMLQSGMRAPMGIKIRGPDLETLERVGLDLERILQTVPGVEPATVLADRMVGKPYLEINVDREAIARHGILVRDVQDVIEVAVGGRRATTMIEGRERYAVRIRYLRELRDTIESLGRILVPTPSGAHIPLEELSDMVYVRGPQVIKSEETFLVAYVTFDKKAGLAEIDVVEEARTRLAVAVESGELIVPAGVSWTFAGNYENQIRSEKKLRVILPIALGIIFLLLHFQFRSMATTALVFSGVLVAWSGGFLMIWLYGRPEFLDFSVFGVSMRDLFQIHPINLSVAVWVGFLALFGIATDDGVIMSTYLTSEFRREPPKTPEEVRDATVRAGLRRIRPCLMTAATTILALLPVLTSTGRGADVMIPMAIPSFGGMTVQLITLLIVPTVWCWMHERKLRRSFPAPEGEVE